MSLLRLVARPMLASMFIVGGLNSIKNVDVYAARAKPVLDRVQPLLASLGDSLPVELDAKMLVRANGVVHVVAGAMLATGRWPRLAALVLAASLVPTTFGGHRYWEESDPAMRGNQRTHFVKNISMGGGLLLAAADTGGRPSVQWLAKRRAARVSAKLARG